MATHSLRPILASPDYRYWRASELVLRNRRPHQSDDAKTKLLFDFLSRSSACGDVSEFENLRDAMPNIFDAIQFRHRASSYLRTNIEAWLVASAPRTIITEQFGLSIKSMGWYESAFYDIREHLAYPSQMLHHVLNIEAAHHAPELRYDCLLKLIAYFGDLNLLHKVSCLGASEAPFSELSDLTRALNEKIEIELVGRLSMDARRIDVGQAHKMLSVIQASADDSEATPQYTEYLKNVEEFLGGIELTMASDALKNATPEERQWMTGAHELRADEEDALARGEKLSIELTNGFGRDETQNADAKMSKSRPGAFAAGDRDNRRRSRLWIHRPHSILKQCRCFRGAGELGILEDGNRSLRAFGLNEIDVPKQRQQTIFSCNAGTQFGDRMMDPEIVSGGDPRCGQEQGFEQFVSRQSLAELIHDDRRDFVARSRFDESHERFGSRLV